MINFANNFSTTLGVALATGDTSLTVKTGDGAKFPAIATPNTAYFTIEEGTKIEVVLVTAHTLGSDVFTITRAADSIGTTAGTAQSFGTTAAVENRVNKAMLDKLVQESDPFTMTAVATTTGLPSTPAAGQMKFWAKDVCGRIMPKWMGPSGVDVVAQPALFGNNISYWQSTTVTAGLWLGTVGAGAGTFTTALPTTTNQYTTTRRSVWKTVVTTTQQQVGQRGSEAMFFLGSGTQGGFFFFCRFGIEGWTLGDRFFVGLTASATPVTAVMSGTITNSVGFVIDGTGAGAGDSAFTFGHTNATAGLVKDTIAGQPALAANNGYDAYIWAAPGGTTVYWRLDNVNTGLTIAAGSQATRIPVAATMMFPTAVASNGANTAVNAAGIGVNRIYIETDF